MADVQKNKVGFWGEVIPKFITPGLLLTIIFLGGKWQHDLDQRSFTSIEKKVRTEDHVDKALTDDQIKTIQDFLKRPSTYVLDSSIDSSFVSRKEYNEWIERDIITNYRTKEAMEDIRRQILVTNTILRRLDANDRSSKKE